MQSLLAPVRNASGLCSVLEDAADPRAALYRMKSVRAFHEYDNQKQALLKMYPQYNLNVIGSRRVFDRMLCAVVEDRGAESQRVVVHSMLITHQLLDSLRPQLSLLEREMRDVQLLVGDRSMVDAVIGRANKPADACFTCVSFPRQTPLAVLAELKASILVLDGLRSSENIGSILRTAYSFGITSVLCTPNVFAGVTGRACRASMGWAFSFHFCVAEDLAASLEELTVCGFLVVSADEHGPTDLRSLRGRVGARPWALVLGAEIGGPSSTALKASSVVVRIPHQKGDSLNVGHAAAICLYALCVQ